MVAGGQNPSKEGSESPIYGSREDEMDDLHGKDEMGKWSGDMTDTKKKTTASLPSSSSFLLFSLSRLFPCCSPLSTRKPISFSLYFSSYFLCLRSYVNFQT